MFAAKCVSKNLINNNDDKNEPFSAWLEAVIQFEIKTWLLIRLSAGKSDQTPEEPHAVLGEQTDPQTQEKR